MSACHPCFLLGDPVLEDSALLFSLLEGDPSALSRLYVRHRGNLMAVVMPILLHHDDATDVVHDFFATLPRRVVHFRAGCGSASGWLATSVRRMALDQYRTAKRRSRLLEEYGRGPSAPARVFAVCPDEAALLDKCLRLLSPPHREALDLFYRQGMSHTCISIQLRLPVSTVKARVRRALVRLRTLAQENHLEFLDSHAIAP